MPSPVRLTMRPRWIVIAGSIKSPNGVRSRARLRSSSALARREWLAISAARIATSLRSPCSDATQNLLELRHHHISPYLLAEFRRAGRDYPQATSPVDTNVVSRDAGHALNAAGLIAFRRAGFAWTVKTYLQCYRFPDIFPETSARNLPKMRSAQKRSLSAYRRRLKRQGMIRVEVQVRKDDAALLRGIAKALTDPTREAETRALLRERFSVVDAIGLKALLAAAPLEGVDLTRDRDLDRDVIV